MAVTSLYEEPEARDEIAWGALEFHDVFKIFRSGPVETVALRGLDLRDRAGELVAVFGRSGSGKSTMLHLAAGLDEPSAGDVRAFGRSLVRLDEVGLADYRAREVAIVFQSDNLWPALSAQENVALSLRLGGASDVNETAAAALAAFGLASGATSEPARSPAASSSASRSPRPRAREAPLVLADEPTGELDEDNEQIVLKALRRLRDDHGSTVIVVTHSPRVADAADRVVEIRDGRVV